MAYQPVYRGVLVLTDDLGPDKPVPHPGCDVCAALHGQWHEAMDRQSVAFDPSFAVDLAIEIGRHPHKKGERS